MHREQRHDALRKCRVCIISIEPRDRAEASARAQELAATAGLETLVQRMRVTSCTNARTAGACGRPRGVTSAISRVISGSIRRNAATPG